MTLWLHVNSGYPSYVDSGAAWRQPDHDAHKLVQALKGKTIKGYLQLQDVDGNLRRFTSEDSEHAFEIFGRWARQKIRGLSPAPAYIVPVPSSICLQLGDDQKGRKLAATVARFAPEYQPLDALHWKQALQKAAEGGTRSASVLLDNLRVIDTLKPSRMVLIDDVVTSGGHLRACAQALRSKGHTVELALAAAQTVWKHPTGEMFGIAPRDLEA